MAILQSPTTVDGSKVVTEATLIPGAKLGQVPIWNPSLRQWLPGDQTGASARAVGAHDHTGTYLSMGGGTLTGPLSVPKLTVAGHAITAAGMVGPRGPGGPAGHKGDRGIPGPAGPAGPAVSHAHPYLPIAGGTVTGATRLQASIVRNIWVYSSTPTHPHQGDIWMH